MKQNEKMAREFAENASARIPHGGPCPTPESSWLAGFRAAREMAARALNERASAHVNRIQGDDSTIARACAVEATACSVIVRKIGEAEEGNPT